MGVGVDSGGDSGGDSGVDSRVDSGVESGVDEGDAVGVPVGRGASTPGRKRCSGSEDIVRDIAADASIRP
jgi:hypothetical protein